MATSTPRASPSRYSSTRRAPPRPRGGEIAVAATVTPAAAAARSSERTACCPARTAAGTANVGGPPLKQPLYRVRASWASSSTELGDQPAMISDLAAVHGASARRAARRAAPTACSRACRRTWRRSRRASAIGRRARPDVARLVAARDRDAERAARRAARLRRRAGDPRDEVQLVSVAATHVNEVQTVTSTALEISEVQQIRIAAPENGHIAGNFSVRFPEVQTVTLTSGSAISSGAFRLNVTWPTMERGLVVGYGSYSTTCISWDASSADLEAALEAMPPIDDVSVSRSGAATYSSGFGYSWTITFVGEGVSGNVPALAVDFANSTTDGLDIDCPVLVAPTEDAFVVAETVDDPAGLSGLGTDTEIQLVVVSASARIADGGYVLGFNGTNTTCIPHARPPPSSRPRSRRSRRSTRCASCARATAAASAATATRTRSSSTAPGSRASAGQDARRVRRLPGQPALDPVRGRARAVRRARRRGPEREREREPRRVRLRPPTQPRARRRGQGQEPARAAARAAVEISSACCPTTRRARSSRSSSTPVGDALAWRERADGRHRRRVRGDDRRRRQRARRHVPVQRLGRAAAWTRRPTRSTRSRSSTTTATSP